MLRQGKGIQSNLRFKWDYTRDQHYAHFFLSAVVDVITKEIHRRRNWGAAVCG